VCSLLYYWSLNGIHIFIVTGSFLYWRVVGLASQHYFIHICIYLIILIIYDLSTSFYVLGMALNCIHTECCPGHDVNFIVAGSFLYSCVIRPASHRFFIHSCIFLRILIITYWATFLGTNSLFVLMCRKTINQSINQSISLSQIKWLNECIPAWFSELPA